MPQQAVMFVKEREETLLPKHDFSSEKVTKSVPNRTPPDTPTPYPLGEQIGGW